MIRTTRKLQVSALLSTATAAVVCAALFLNPAAKAAFAANSATNSTRSATGNDAGSTTAPHSATPVAKLTRAMPHAHAEEDEGKEGVGESNGDPGSKDEMVNHGGAVQTTPRIYLVFWGSNWFSGGDPDGVARRLHYFYSGISASSWASVMKQYTSRWGTFTNPTNQYKSWMQDNTPVPQEPTMADMAAAARRAALRTGDTSYNAQYVIALPWGYIDQKTAEGACAWHSWTYAGPQGNWITYTSLPYTPYLDQLYKARNTSCGGGWVNGSGSAGVLDGVTINAGHEYAETVTDPGTNAWYAGDTSGENGDKCAWTHLYNRAFPNGMTFPVQPTWSNSASAATGNGCPQA